MSSPRRTIVDELIAAMQSRPDDFHAGEHTLTDRKSGMTFWIANGRFAAGVYSPFTLWFGLYHSARFHRSLRLWKAWRAAKSLRQNKRIESGDAAA